MNNRAIVYLQCIISASSKSQSDFGDETDVKLLLLLDAFMTSVIDVEISMLNFFFF